MRSARIPAHIAVIDIGKTNAKLALVRAKDLSEIAVLTQPNRVRPGPPYPHFDVEAIWEFLLAALRTLHRDHGIDGISVTTHGAAGALLTADGGLAAPILDYEHRGPETTASAYDALRPGFAETGSPRLPMGLNLGAQIHWQCAQDPSLLDRTAAIVTYPQYWGHRLTGVRACDVTSLGCHTDLWNPQAARFSSLVERLGLEAKMAPAHPSAARLGPVRPDLAQETGLSPETSVFCGIHDSNASLLPHVLRRAPPFSVVSTGTWVIAMTMGGAPVTLDPSRDTLMNVNALGAPVPSARFMGGREYDIGQPGAQPTQDPRTLLAVADTGPLLMPALVSDSGPFQGRRAAWIGPEPDLGSPQRGAALSFYLAMMTAQCLSLTGHRGPIVVEGPFATNPGFCTMLAAATACPVAPAATRTGTSQGAALLALGQTAPLQSAEPDAEAASPPPSFVRYAARWRHALNGP